WGIAMGLQTAILGHMTDSVITANSIASTLFQILSVFSYGSATAASVMIGKTIGEAAGDTELLKSEIRHRSSRMQGIFLILGVLTGLSIFAAKDLIIGFYDVSSGTRDMALAFMTVLSVTAVGTSYQMPCLTGIVRGGGDTGFVLFNDIIFMWCIVLPASFIAFRMNLPPVIIFACLKSDQILKCFVAVVKVNRYRWMKKI
ncbi:MAG: MATE family efflux transporter, partial [Clostridia bacterium]|nr:MATE family efflux transporter [Clostridia bacterium]